MIKLRLNNNDKAKVNEIKKRKIVDLVNNSKIPLKKKSEQRRQTTKLT